MTDDEKNRVRDIWAQMKTKRTKTHKFEPTVYPVGAVSNLDEVQSKLSRDAASWKSTFEGQRLWW